MQKEHQRAFKFVNYVLTAEQSIDLLRLRQQLSRGFDPISVSVLLEWFYLSAMQLPKVKRTQLERELNSHAVKFEYPDHSKRQRTGARLDEVVADWIVSTTEQTVNTGLSAILSYLARSEKNKYLVKFTVERQSSK